MLSILRKETTGKLIKHSRLLTKLPYVLCLILALSVTACSYVYKDAHIRYHMINVDPDGKYTPSHPNIPFDPDDSIDDLGIYGKFLATLFEKVEAEDLGALIGPRHIVIYVHGGLNMSHNSIKRVDELHETLRKDGVYPIFINWRSFFFTTYGAHLGGIRQGKVSRLAPVTAPLYFITDIASALVRAPRAWVIQGSHVLNTLSERGVGFARRLLFGRKPTKDPNPVESAYVHYVPSDTPQRHTKLKNQIWWWVSTPGTLLLNPFVSEIGRPSWNMMLRRDKTLFRKPSEFRNDECLDKKNGRLTPEKRAECFQRTGGVAIFSRKTSNLY